MNKKASIAVFAVLATAAGSVLAQTTVSNYDGNTVTTSTDPMRAADIEQRAQQLQSSQPGWQSGATPKQGKWHDKGHHMMHHHAMHHGKGKKAAPAAGASTSQGQ